MFKHTRSLSIDLTLPSINNSARAIYQKHFLYSRNYSYPGHISSSTNDLQYRSEEVTTAIEKNPGYDPPAIMFFCSGRTLIQSRSILSC
jgi:hypothetical protein